MKKLQMKKTVILSKRGQFVGKLHRQIFSEGIWWEERKTTQVKLLDQVILNSCIYFDLVIKDSCK